MAETKKPMGRRGKALLGCVIIVALLGICGFTASAAGLLGLGKIAEEVSESIEESETQQIDVEEEEWENSSEVGAVVAVKDITWTVVEVENLGSTIPGLTEFNDACVSESGEFIYVKTKVKNNSNEMQSTSGLYLYDSEKREFTSSSDVYGCVEDELFILENINPGIELTLVEVFEVPTTSSGFKLKITDLDLLNDSHKYISLGF